MASLARLRRRGGPQYELVDTESETVDVPSSWRKAAHTADFEAQTEPLMFANAKTQTRKAKVAETQTDELEGEALAADICTGLDSWNLSGALASFVQSVAPMMSAQLERNATSHAFDDYDMFTSDGTDQVEALHTLSMGWAQPEEEETKAGAGNGAGAGTGAARVEHLPCTGVSWTATGSMLCASFGRLDHQGWCTHRAGLAAWNLFQRNFDPKKPAVSFETMSCLMCVACHPEMPSIVAAGSFNGEVMVWDMNNTDEPLIGRSRVDDYFHREPVARVEWMRDILSKQYSLASVSADGKVLFWSMENKLKYPTHGYRLTPKRSMRRRATRDASGVVGGTALSFSRDGKYSSSFIVASEGGGMFKCLIRSGGGPSATLPQTELRWTQPAVAAMQRVPIADRATVVQHVERHARGAMAQKVDMAALYASKPNPAKLFPSPIDFSYEGHTGPVHCLDCSPFHRNLFMSCGADGRLNLHSMLSAHPLTWYEPSSSYLFSAAWSKVRPAVFAAGDGDGVVHVFDLQQSLAGPVVTLKQSTIPDPRRFGGDASAAPVYSLAFNPRWRNLMAFGDGTGSIYVWRLGWKLSTPQPQEEANLASLVESWEDDGELMEED